MTAQAMRLAPETKRLVGKASGGAALRERLLICR